MNRPDPSPASLVRSLERAAVRDLETARRDAYRQEDLQDKATVERLRRERNERADELGRQERQVRTAWELALGERRVSWIDAHTQAWRARSAANAAVRADRAAHRADERAELSRLRAEHNATADKLDAEEASLDRERELATSDLRESWNEARGRRIEAQRAMRAAVREQRRSEAAARPERTSNEAAARQERVEASGARWEVARKATLAHGAALAELNEAKRGGADPAKVAELAKRAEELHAKSERLEHEARMADLDASDALFDERSRAAADRAGVESQLRGAYLEARSEEVLAKRRVRSAIRAVKTERRPQDDAARTELRERRLAADEAYRRAVWGVYAERGRREAELRDDWLTKRDVERSEKRAAKTDERAYAAAHKKELHAELEQIRLAKVAVGDEFSQAVYGLRRDRGVARAEEREVARQAARDVFASYQAQVAQGD